MSTFTKYLETFNKPFASLPANRVTEVKELIKSKQSNQPLVSVVAIAHNEQNRIFSCLWSIYENKYDQPMEVIIINNNSTDQTTEVLDELGATWYNEEKKGPGHARQCGLDKAKGKYTICVDADTLYPPFFIESHMKQLVKSDVAGSYSLWSFIPSESRSRFSMFVYEGLRDVYLRIQAIKRPELNVRGMAFGFKTEYARKIGFNTRIIRGEDGSMAVGLKKYGKLKFITSQKARVLTDDGTLNNDQTLFNSFKIRIIKAFKQTRMLFTSQSEYKDKDSNIIK